MNLRDQGHLSRQGHPSMLPVRRAPLSPYAMRPKDFGERRRPLKRLLLVATAIGALVLVGFLLWQRSAVAVKADGVADGRSFAPGAIHGHQIRINVSNDQVGSAELQLNGQRLTDVAVQGDDVVWTVPNLVDGVYTLTAKVPWQLFGETTKSWKFTIDGVAPVLGVPPAVAPVPIDQPFVLDGTLDGATTVSADGGVAEVADGHFHLRFDRPPAAPIEVTATDAAGNTSTAEVVVPALRPETHAVHVTAIAWGNDGLRKGIIALIDAKKIDTVELDLKDEGGVVGYDSAVPLAAEIGARQPSYELAAAVADLHGRGVRVIGRVVAFRDPILSKAAWDKGDKDWVLQKPDGSPLGAYGGFTNFANEGVRQYNIDLASEAAKAGVDEILWDYVRRPEGPLEEMVIPGLTGTPSDAVSVFLAEGHTKLRALGALQGASVFGIAASRPEQIAQDVPSMARNTDYIAPMLYPSHWNKGEYDVADPNRQPYDIIKASLADFQKVMANTNKPLVPWLQDFSDGVTYGKAQVNAQIAAGKDLGVGGWLLWSPTCKYTL